MTNGSLPNKEIIQHQKSLEKKVERALTPSGFSKVKPADLLIVRVDSGASFSWPGSQTLKENSSIFFTATMLMDFKAFSQFLCSFLVSAKGGGKG